MAGSIHLNGKKLADAGAGLERHIEREDEKEAEVAKKYTGSFIDPTQTHYNQIWQRGTMKEIRDELKEVNERRKEQGKKAFRKDANIFMTGTLQLSDDTLMKLGMQYDEEKKSWLKWEEQPEKVQDNVTRAYKDMFNSISQQPERYGKMHMASLHLDESSPHVDIVTLAIDRDHVDMKARDFLNGPKGTPKGQKMREMQDNLFKYSKYNERTREHFGLVRGDTQQQRKDRLRKVRADEERVRQQAKVNEERLRQQAKANEERLRRKAEENEEAVRVLKEHYEENSPGLLNDVDYKTPSQLAEFFIEKNDEWFWEKYNAFERLKEGVVKREESLKDLAQRAYEKGYKDGHAQREREDRDQLFKNISEDLDRRATTSRGRGSNTGRNGYDFDR